MCEACATVLRTDAQFVAEKPLKKETKNKKAGRASHGQKATEPD